MDERMRKLANNLIRYSTELKPGEKVLIHANGIDGVPLARLLVKEAYAVGAVPFVKIDAPTMLRELLFEAKEEQLKLWSQNDEAFMAQMDAYIGVRSTPNDAELSDVPPEKLAMYQRLYSKPVHTDTRVNHTKWCVLRYPTTALAQAAGRSQEAFENYFYKVCCLDYAKMSRAMDPLASLMERTDKVRIVGPGTDLSFSIQGIPAVKCDGKRNIPDGEVYTAPVRDSVNGRLTYNTPSEYQGYTYENISFTFKDGKIVEATANDNRRVNDLLDTDESARYIGEFSFGVNPYILKPMKNILFDEKIMGSFHFTPGSSYDLAYNGNKSAIHWDLVCIQTPEYGGGEIWFDDVCIRKDGQFILPELAALNPGGF